MKNIELKDKIESLNNYIKFLEKDIEIKNKMIELLIINAHLGIKVIKELIVPKISFKENINKDEENI